MSTAPWGGVAPVTAVREVAPEVFEVMLEAPVLAERTTPGQFFQVKTGDTTFLRRPLSLWRREGKEVGLLFRVLGAGTRWLSERRSGEPVDLVGPLGRGFPPAREGRGPLILVGGGLGVAPLLPLAREAREAGRPVVALLGFRSGVHLLGVDLFARTCDRVEVATEDGSVGRKGYVIPLLRELLQRGEAAEVAACGPVPLLKAVQAAVPPSLPAFLSLEERMGCGMGACLGCSAGGVRVCYEGPVLPAREVHFS